MVARRWTLDEANGNLREVLERAETDGPQEVSDPRGGVFRIEAEPEILRGGIREGERFSQWLRRTLEPGEQIDDFRLRNAGSNQHRERWIWEMVDQAEAETGQADDSEMDPAGPSSEFPR